LWPATRAQFYFLPLPELAEVARAPLVCDQKKNELTEVYLHRTLSRVVGPAEVVAAYCTDRMIRNAAVGYRGLDTLGAVVEVEVAVDGSSGKQGMSQTAV